MGRKKPLSSPPGKDKSDPEPVIIMSELGASLYYPRGTKPGFDLGSLPDMERPPRHPRDLLGIIGFPPIDLSLSDAERIGRFWQLWVLRIGLYLPAAIAAVVAFVLVAFPSLALWLGMDPKHITFGEYGPLRIILGIALFGAMSCWPFIALGRAANRRIKFMWPDVRAARPAIIGALIGLSAIHGSVFFGVGSVMVMDDPSAEQTAEYLIGLLVVGFGWTLGGLGWLCGSIIGRMLRRPPVPNEPA